MNDELAEWEAHIKRCEQKVEAGEAVDDEELRILAARGNRYAEKAVARLSAEYGDAITLPFQASTLTYGRSVDDDFFKAKSPEYLRDAERHSDQVDALRNDEEGWPYADYDLGDEPEGPK